ncbi:MAG: potassium channel family protein [Actinomycetota bacterium]|nr:potassium channel family protein [Actinomycetota bacterium]
MARKDPTERKYYDRFDLLLVVSVVTVGLLLLVDLDQGEGFAELLSVTVTILTATMLMLAVAAAGVGRRGRRFAWIAVALTVSASVIGAFLPVGDEAHGGLLWLVLVVAAPVLAVVRLVHHKEIKAETLLGAVSVYLMMAIAGTYLFLFLDSQGGSAGEFFGSQQPTTVFMYYSLVTITTLGYGDFFPVGVFGRAAAGWVAVIGQIYLVVVVAYIVAMFTSARTRGSDSASADDD